MDFFDQYSWLGRFDFLTSNMLQGLNLGVAGEREELERGGEERRGTHSPGEPKPFVRTASLQICDHAMA